MGKYCRTINSCFITETIITNLINLDTTIITKFYEFNKIDNLIYYYNV